MPYCPCCGKAMSLDAEDIKKKNKGLIRWWNNQQGIKHRVEITEEDLRNENNNWAGNLPENWEIMEEDHSERYACECGVEGVGYHPVFGKTHSPGDSFAYKFEYIK
jgi:FtsZ-binding cell division protein ZapB